MAGYPNFDQSEFTEYIKTHGIDLNPISPRSHTKNVLDSKHRIVRSILIRLLDEDHYNYQSASVQSVRISNELCETDILSALEKSKGFIKPILNVPAEYINKELLEAQEQLDAKQNITRILTGSV